MSSLDSPEQQQINLTLAYVVNNGARNSYAGWQDTKNPSPSQVRDNILQYLNGSKMGAGYGVVWGPALVLDGDTNNYAANITVVLMGGKNNEIVIVTSGTNPDSGKDLLDDLTIFPMIPLRKYIPSCPLSVNISQGADWGVSDILKTPSSLNSQGTLSDFIAKLPSNTTIKLVGHSLGGALMSVLALCLRDQFPNINFYCQTFAAPTAGDGNFASYFNHQMAGNALRIYNELDVVPLGWCATSLDRALTLYPSTVQVDPDTVKSVNQNIDFIEFNNLNYTQWGMGGAQMELKLAGKVNADYNTYKGQAGYQHIYEYISLVGLQLSDIPMPPPGAGS